MTLSSWLGCDSVIDVTITPILPDTVLQNATVCAGGCVDIDGKESTLAVLGNGKFFGEISILDEGPRSSNVVTKRPRPVVMP